MTAYRYLEDGQLHSVISCTSINQLLEYSLTRVAEDTDAL